MKKYYLLFLGVIFMVIIMSFNSAPDKRYGSESFFSDSTLVIPENVNAILNESCTDCHWVTGKALARSKLDFSDWRNYDLEKQIKKAEKMCEEVTDGDMPPKKYRSSNPDKIPTQEQIKVLCEWAESLKTEQ